MANYFAQTSNGNITGTNMWNSAANGTGTSYTLTLGANGNTGFYGIAGDAAAVLIANNKGTIVIDANVAAQELRNDITGGATAGGVYSLNNNITINANFYGYTTNALLTTSGTISGTINGTIFSSSGSSGFVVGHGSSGTLTINGNLSASGNYCVSVTTSNGTLNVNNGTLSPGTLSGSAGAVSMQAGGTLNVNNCTIGATTGNPYAIVLSSISVCTITNSTINNYGLNISGSAVVTATASVTSTSANGNCITISGGTLNLTGNITNSGGANGLLTITGGIVYITGNILSGTSHSISISSNGSLVLTGSVVGGSGPSSNGVYLTGGSPSVTINGNITGGSNNLTNSCGLNVTTNTPTSVVVNGTVTGGSVGAGLINLGTGTNITINGTAIGGTGAPGIYNQSTGSVFATRAKGNGFGNGSVGLTSQPGAQSLGNGYIVVQEIEYGDLGQSPTAGPVFLNPATTNIALFYRPGLSKKTLISADSVLNVFPSASNVRKGVSFNAGNSVGTMAVPPAASVASGVAVDNTVGTAFLNASDVTSVWNVAISGIGVSGSIGERLKNCSTVATMGQQLATSLTNVS